MNEQVKQSIEKMVGYHKSMHAFPDEVRTVEEWMREQETETVNHPAHYNQHPSKIECIDVVRWMNFNLGNAIKYIWRAGGKPGTDTVTDLKKAIWYLQDEISRLEEFHVREPESEQEVVREIPKQDVDEKFQYYKEQWERNRKYYPTADNAKAFGVSIGVLSTWWDYMVAGEKADAR